MIQGELLARQLADMGGKFQRQEDSEYFVWGEVDFIRDRIDVRELARCQAGDDFPFQIRKGRGRR